MAKKKKKKKNKKTRKVKTWKQKERMRKNRKKRTYTGFGGSDGISKKGLSQFLSQWLQENPAAERPVKVDITQTFPWWLHLNTTPAGRDVLKAGVKQVELVEKKEASKKCMLSADELQLRVTCENGWSQTFP